VTISSIGKTDFYPPPELKNVLVAAENLRAEFTMQWDGEIDMTRYRRVMENLETIQEAVTVHYKEFAALERDLVAAASSGMTEKQRMLLMWLSENHIDGVVYTVLIERLSNALNIPRSTVRWNLRGLRETGFIRAGNRENKGIPVDLTEMGRLVMNYLQTS
jgi:DNA-binding MarR family transcriptional regulator